MTWILASDWPQETASGTISDASKDCAEHLLWPSHFIFYYSSLLKTFYYRKHLLHSEFSFLCIQWEYQRDIFITFLNENNIYVNSIKCFYLDYEVKTLKILQTKFMEFIQNSVVSLSLKVIEAGGFNFMKIVI